MWHLAQRIPCFHSFKDGQRQSVFGHQGSSKGFLLAKRSIYMPCGSYLSCGLTGKPFTAMLGAHDSCKRCTELGTSVSNKGIKRQQLGKFWQTTRKLQANPQEQRGCIMKLRSFLFICDFLAANHQAFVNLGPGKPPTLQQ